MQDSEDGFLKMTLKMTLKKTLKMVSAQVVETSVTNNSPSQDFNHPDDLFQSRYERYIPFQIETKIDDIRKLSHKNLISQLMNSNDYYVNLRLNMSISSCFQMRDKVI